MQDMERWSRMQPFTTGIIGLMEKQEWENAYWWLPAILEDNEEIGGI